MSGGECLGFLGVLNLLAYVLLGKCQYCGGYYDILDEMVRVEGLRIKGGGLRHMFV